jgi:hypothetical protein
MTRKSSILFIYFLVSARTIRKPTDESDRIDVITTNNEYCRLDTKTLKRKPCHRAGFFFNKRGSLRSTKQVIRNIFNKNYFFLFFIL